jgi:two-component system, NarL family, invasion response regulator UvrY
VTRILVVDDHELLRRGLRSILTSAFPEDLTLVEAVDAREALAAVQKQACDVALVDINLPGRGGLELLQDLRGLHPQMPVIVLSAYPERDYALRALSSGLRVMCPSRAPRQSCSGPSARL